eukprot:11226399-Lingulodinium_polyedra.AAC.1
MPPIAIPSQRAFMRGVCGALVRDTVGSTRAALRYAKIGVNARAVQQRLLQHAFAAGIHGASARVLAS